MKQERMTVEQYRKEIGLPPVQPPPGRTKATRNDTVDVLEPKMNPGGKQRPSKYGAKKTKVDGITFDSKAEAEYYIHLKDRMRLGEIAGFGRQVEFILQDGDGTVIRYKADFVVWERAGGVSRHYIKGEVHEVKGHETPEWKLKEKLFLARYPDIKLVVVK